MKHSPYIAWARAHAGTRYNLARSGMPRRGLGGLGVTLDDVLGQDAPGDAWPPLAAAIAARYGVTPDHVVVTTGATLGNHVVMAALLAPGDEALVEHPVYEPLALVPAHLQARVVALPRPAGAGWAVRADDVRRRVSPRTRLVVLSNLHNPTGALVDDESLDALAALADQHGFHVLVDEVYLELDGPPRTAASRSPWFVTTRSLTKAFGLDALRVGWILAEPALAARVRRMHDLFASSVAHPSERLARLVLDRADEMLAPTLALLAHQRARVEVFVAAEPRLTWTPPRAGTVGFVRLDGGAGGGAAVDALAARLAREHDTAIVPGRFFGVADHFRLGWSMPADILEAGLERLAAALAS